MVTHCYNGNKIQIIEAPEIPNSVTNMDFTFSGCTSLTTVSNLPDSLENMSLTFTNCISLVIAPHIPNGVQDMYSAFWRLYQSGNSATINSK